MKTFSEKSSSKDTLTRNRQGTNHKQVPVKKSVPAFPGSIPLIQRKSLCPCDGGCPRCKGVIQPKLTIGQPNDKYEQEAERVADRIMRMPEKKESLVNGHLSLVQRKKGCSNCREEEEKGPVQLKLSTDKSPPVAAGLQSQIQSMRGGGQPLPESTRAFFEPRFGQDFRRVRLHKDSRAAETAKSVKAKAFTIGNDVVFGVGQYSPGTITGKRLLAHELTHVIQQNPPKPVKSGAAPKNYEQEADHVADQVMHMPEPGNQRQSEYSVPTCSDEEEQVQTKLIGNQVTPLDYVQRQEEEETIPGEEVESFINNGVTFYFKINMINSCFNDGPGLVVAKFLHPPLYSTLYGTEAPPEMLRFFSSSPKRNADLCAWEFTVDGYNVEFDYQSEEQLPGYHMGFIMTAERIHYEAHYQNLTPKIIDVTNAREAINSSVQAPWNNDLNQPNGPIDLRLQDYLSSQVSPPEPEQEPESKPTPKIRDTPFVDFRVWGHQSQEQNPLQSVNASGIFHIWLVVKHQNDPGDQLNSLNFLYHISLRYNRSWSYQGHNPSIDQGSASSYIGSGGQQIESQGVGIGSATPVLTGQIANEQLKQQVDAIEFPSEEGSQGTVE